MDEILGKALGEDFEKELKKAKMIQYCKYVGVAVLVGTAGYMAYKCMKHLEGIDESLKKIEAVKGAQLTAPETETVTI